MAVNDPFTPTEGLRVIAACPLCDERYSPLQAHVLEAREGAHLLHLECRNCGSAVVAAVRSDQVGVSSLGVLTDLTSDDVVKFKDTPGVTTPDDVLDLHRLLSGDPPFGHLLSSS